MSNHIADGIDHRIAQAIAHHIADGMSKFRQLYCPPSPFPLVPLLPWLPRRNFACMLQLVGARACMPLRGFVGGGI